MARPRGTGEFQDWQGLFAERLLELLHRESDGDLNPDEAAELGALSLDPEVRAARDALRRGVTLLSAPHLPRPHPPRSVAASVARDIALGRQLAAPPAPRSVASDVASDVTAARVLGHALALPHSVARAAVHDLQMARMLTPPGAPRSIAADLAAEVAAQRVLGAAPPSPSRSVAALVAGRVRQAAGEGRAPSRGQLPTSPSPSPAAFALQAGPPARPAALLGSLAGQAPRRNLAPLYLVASLLSGLTLLLLTSAWPNLATGALILQAVLEQVSPLAWTGLLLLLVTSALVTWRPSPGARRFGALSFALAGLLTLPPLYQVASGGSGLTFGRNVVISGPVRGNIVVIGGDVTLEGGARVQGRVVTLLGDVQREPGAQVRGEVSALLGQAPDRATAPTPAAPQGLTLATAAAFRPLLGWLGAAAWPQIFVTLTGGLLLLLFVAGAAPQLARRQRHAPMRTLALGILMLAALLLPALALGVSGLLGPALIAAALAALLISTGLSVSLYDAGRVLAAQLRLPVPDTVGALLGLSTFAASLSLPPLAFALALVGGAWGAGTLFLSHRTARSADPEGLVASVR
ncbi:hypothetical protein SAMN04488058_1218 [Deinococcus reticulitermitis]|uniref:Polymer-forming protein n=1 Tax=Deinococcus reticulitermitis TaxID=856736 RepID=A0A1H7BYP2_9DEIO|nr:polymer-forming cytoskeletal protein [Deinococcus reticulitermitis]SEJ82689.1 hypothetical protein SAMN04488058_1218 [Deinococcus reticulitermitis]